MKVLFLVNYAPHAIKSLIGGSDRETAVKALVESVGGKLEHLMFTRGAFDLAVMAKVPDQAASMGVAMAIRASGALSDVVVLEELDGKAMIEAAQKAAKAYKPPA